MCGFVHGSMFILLAILSVGVFLRSFCLMKRSKRCRFLYLHFVRIFFLFLPLQFCVALYLCLFFLSSMIGLSSTIRVLRHALKSIIGSWNVYCTSATYTYGLNLLSFLSLLFLCCFRFLKLSPPYVKILVNSAIF